MKIKSICKIAIFSITIQLFIFGNLFSQENFPKYMVSVESGWNSKAGGMGATIDYNIFDNFSTYISGGMGFWGYAGGAGIRYFPSGFSNGLMIGAGVNEYSGYWYYESKMTNEMKIKDNNVEYTYKRLPTTTGSVLIGYYFKVSDTSRIFLESGYAYKLTKKTYEENKKPLSKNLKDSMGVFDPGGFIFSVGFSVAVNFQ